VLTASREEADTYEALVRAGVSPRLAANWQTQDVARLANEQRLPLAQSGLGVAGLAALLQLLEAGTINGTTAKELLAELYVHGGDPRAIVEQRGLAKVSDESQVSALVDAAIAAEPGAAEDFRSGKQDAIGPLMRHVKEASGGTADMKLANKLLRERLAG